MIFTDLNPKCWNFGGDLCEGFRSFAIIVRL